MELLIVVAIILIIATIAIPSLLRSRQAANESGAVATMRTIMTAEVSYQSSAQGSFGTLTQLVGAGLLDARFTSGTFGGFNYGMRSIPREPSSLPTLRACIYEHCAIRLLRELSDGVVRYANHHERSSDGTDPG